MGKQMVPLVILMHRNDYRNLYCIDSDKDIYNSPFYTAIRYVYGEPSDTHFPPSFFKMVVFVDAGKRDINERILSEALRVVEPGGYVAKIVHRRRTSEFGDQEEGFGKIQVVKAAGIDLVVYRKGPGFSTLQQNLRGISLLSYTKDRGGISEYSRNLKNRIQNELGIEVQEISEPSETRFDIVLIEFESGLSGAKNLLEDVAFLKNLSKNIVIEVHDWLTRFRFTQSDVKFLENNTMLLYRTNENALFDKAKNYYLCPHVAYRTLSATNNLEENTNGSIVIGSFGFASHSKKFVSIIRLALALKVEARLVISQNEERDLNIYKDVISRLQSFRGVRVVHNRERSEIYINNIIVKLGYLNEDQLYSFLSGCSHFVFSHKSNYWASGAMTYAKQLRKPILALDSFQARQAQVFRVKIFSRKDEIFDGLHSLIRSIYKLDAEGVKSSFSKIYNGVRYRSVSLSDFEKCRDIPRDEDGLIYIHKIITNCIRENRVLAVD
ncbi:MAG: hypothetical protein QXV32_03720 [Conexivisphaerales archaeon]